MRAWLRLMWVGVALVGGCRSAPPPAPPGGQLMLELVPAQASVLVDDKPLVRRPAGALRVELPVGPHRVEAYAPGYFHAYHEVAVGQGAPAQLKVVLRADPDADAEKPDPGEAGLLPPMGGRPAAP